nr:hypothetical protein GCM10025730_31500 [Promicromonospora thailandica]
MRIGTHFMRFDSMDPAGMRTELADAARYADEGGVSWISVMDHYFQMVHQGFPASDPMLEAYTTLGYLAGVTEKVQLGSLVTGVTYRYPGLLAKIVASLDVVSGGRATYGIGAAWYDREHAALGVPFPELRDRFEMLEETVRIARQMYDPDDNGPFEGKHFRLAETLCSPQPLSKPEIMIGGSGRSARSGWWRSTRTRATCSPRRRSVCVTCSTCCAGTATTWAGTSPTSGSRCCTGAHRSARGTPPPSSRRCAGSRATASTP